MNDQQEEQEQEQEIWNDFQLLREAQKADAIEAEYNKFMDGDTETMLEIARNAWEYTPEETEAEEQEIEAEYFVSYVTIPESAIQANISTSNHVDGKYFVCLEGGADGWCGYTDTLAEAQALGKALIAEYLTTE